MSAMTVSKSYMVLLGLEGYARTKKKLAGVGKGVRSVFGGGGGGGEGKSGSTTEGGALKSKSKAKVEVEVEVRGGKKKM